MSENLLVTLGVQDKGTTKQVTALNKELRFLDKEFKSTGKSSKDFEKTQEGLKTKLNYLEKSYTANKSKLEVYKKKLNETKESIKAKEVELEKLTSAENVNEKAVEKVSKQLDTMRGSLRQTEQNISLTEIELENLSQELESTNQALQNQALEKYKQEIKELGSQIEQSGERISKFGQGLNTAGTNLMAMSAPLVAFAGYSVKVAMDFEAAMSNVEAISGATAEELERMSAKAKEMGASTSKSAKEAADGMSYMALAGWNTQQILTGIEPVLRLAEAGNLDLGRASDLTTDSLSALGIEVKDLNRYLDICAQAQRKSNTTADAMMEAYIGCGGTLKNLKVPLEESATYIGILANRGKKGSEAGNALNSVLINLTSGAGQAGVAMGNLGLSAFDSSGNFKGMNVVLTELGNKLAKCTEEQKNQYLAMIGGKTQIDTLNALLSGTSEEYSKLHREIANSNGALDEMAKTMQNNAKGNVTKLKSQLEGLGIQIGEKLLPHINTMIGYLSNLIEWFGNLGEGTQQTIIKMGLLTFATGGALKAIGSITTGIGGLVSITGRSIGNLSNTTNGVNKLNRSSITGAKGIAKLGTSLLKINPITIGVGVGVAALAGGMKVAKTNSEMMGKTVLDVTDDMSSLEKGLNKVNNMHFKSREELVKLGLVYKDFGNNISEDFQMAVKTSQKSLMDFNLSLKEINLDNVLSDKEIKVFTNTVEEMCKGTVEIIKGKQQESKNALSEMFKLDDDKIDENEKKVLEILQKNSNLQIEEVTKLEQEIYAIKKAAIAEKGYLNEQEIKDIELKMQRIKQIELESVGATNEELLFARNEFNARISSIDLEGAATLVQEKAKLRDEEITQISAAYDTQLQLMQEKLPLLNEEERKVLEEQILKHTETKDTKIKQQYDLYNEYLRIMGEKNPAILAEIDSLNGNILTADDKKAQEQLRILQESYGALNKVTQDGTYLMENTQTGAWQRVSVMIDQNTGKVVAATDNMYKKSGANNSKIAKDVQDMAKKHNEAQRNIQDTINKSGDVTVDSSGKIITANGKTVYSLENVETAADGTRTGIINLNGTPVEVKVNKEGTIDSINAIKFALDGIKSKTITVTTKNINLPTSQSSLVGKNINGMNDQETKVIGFIPKIPNDYNNIISDGGYYNQKSAESTQLINTFNGLNVSNFKNSSENIDYNKLANIINNTIISSIKNLAISPEISVTIDGTVLNSKISNDMAMNIKRRR